MDVRTIVHAARETHVHARPHAAYRQETQATRVAVGRVRWAGCTRTPTSFQDVGLVWKSRPKHPLAEVFRQAVACARNCGDVSFPLPASVKSEFFQIAVPLKERQRVSDVAAFNRFLLTSRATGSRKTHTRARKRPLLFTCARWIGPRLARTSEAVDGRVSSLCPCPSATDSCPVASSHRAPLVAPATLS